MMSPGSIASIGSWDRGAATGKWANGSASRFPLGELRQNIALDSGNQFTYARIHELLQRRSGESWNWKVTHGSVVVKALSYKPRRSHV
jgi:hypothetical protein